MRRRVSRTPVSDSPGEQQTCGRGYSLLAARALPAMLSPPAQPSGFIEPCLPTLSRTVPDGPRWAFEVKHDGYRFIARRDGDRVRVFSRNAKDWTDKVPAIVEAMLALLPRASSRSGGIGRIGRAGAPTGSRSRTPSPSAATRIMEW